MTYSKYKGMRWRKCNLHLHTAADSKHWLGDRLEEGQESIAAKAFAEACYQQRLDIIAVTDHNFLSKDFIRHLLEAFKDIEQNFNHKIKLFVGFEFEADVGKGIHVLCLFETIGISIDRIDHITNEIDHTLTLCGVEGSRIKDGRLAKSRKQLSKILSVVQKPNSDGTWRGIVILPHVFEDSLFDNDRINEWLQQEEFKNPDLLAVEVPKPTSQLRSSWQKLFRSGEDCHNDWKRIRPIATLMSSDNKKLVEVDKDGKPVPNSLGYRYSWIKMSDPSIESLRQAFLDHESRIILPEDVSTDTNPDKRIRHARVKSISIKNVAFLADQEVHFSPNLNCIIGGRGSGKSTLLEYLRIILGKDKSQGIDDGTRERIKRVRDTLSSEAELEVCWISADGVEDRIVWQNSHLKVHDRELPDPDTFFNNLPIRFYSQQQLNRLTESKTDNGSAQRLLELIDGFTRNELDELADQEHKLKLKIEDAFSNIRKAKTLEKDFKRLQQEHLELKRQWQARSEIQEDARRHQLLKAESRYIEELGGGYGKQFADIRSIVETIASSHKAFQFTDSPHTDWFRQFDDKVKVAKSLLTKIIGDAIDNFELAVDNLKRNDPVWNTIQKELDEADAKFREACAAKGLTPDDVGHLQEINQSLTKKQHEIDKIGEEIKRLKETSGDAEQLMKQLHQIWHEQFQQRVKAAERANELAVLNEGRQRFIKVSIEYLQDSKSFLNLWQNFAPSDKRTRLGKNWERCGEILYELFIKQDDAESPWQILENCLSEEQHSAGPNFESNSQDLFQHIQNNLERWEKLRCSRVQDTVDITLLRADGSTAGSISKGSLSDGQRNTAALALLLAQEGGPLVIDQPEDELDSNFVFKELIPMLRKVKWKRQLILSTHNANLPVNGDAELVYAFEAREGKGELLACGGLDQSSVTKAVLDIMEGTEEAFRRRREKYHF